MASFQPYKFGKYSIVGEIASGGMARLLKAKMSGEHGFEKVLAIKKIHSHFESEGEMLEAFIDEARLAAQLQHHNIVQVVDFGNVQGEYFIAMEYLEGFDLRSVLSLAASSGQQLDTAHALFILAKVCEGLHYAHSLKDNKGKPLKIIHRDISPANILITSNGEVKIIDFGIARATSYNRSTMVGTLKGKIPYMAPEQAFGSQIDHRVDIYSVGAVLYEVFSGHPLFAGAGVDTLEKVKNGEFKPPEEAIPGQTEDFYRILSRSLAADPDRRYQSCMDMLDDIESYMTSRKLRPTNRSLKEFIEAISPKHRKLDGGAVAPVEATEVCDLSAASDDSANEEVSFFSKLLAVSHSLIPEYFRYNLSRIAILSGLVMVLLFTCQQMNKKYTAFNIWVPRDSTLHSINYKGNGALLPAGSLIKDVTVDETANTITFSTVDGRTVVINFKAEWHPGKTVAQFAKSFATSKNFKELTDDMSEEEVSAIKSGVLIAGMSKPAVLVAYGPPPEQGTISTEANQWTYWQSRFDRRDICFDEENKLLPVCPTGIKGQGKNVIENFGSKIRGLLGGD